MRKHISAMNLKMFGKLRNPAVAFMDPLLNMWCCELVFIVLRNTSVEKLSGVFYSGWILRPSRPPYSRGKRHHLRWLGAGARSFQLPVIPHDSSRSRWAEFLGSFLHLGLEWVTDVHHEWGPRFHGVFLSGKMIIHSPEFLRKWSWLSGARTSSEDVTHTLP